MANEVTMKHIRRAVKWAKTARKKPMPIDGTVRTYNQDRWDAGNHCCIWGAACILAGKGYSEYGPPDDWASTAKRRRIFRLLFSTESTLKQFEAALNKK